MPNTSAYNALCGGVLMRIPWEMVLAFSIGLALMCLVGYLLLVPMRFLWRLAAGGVLGAVVLMVVNLFGGMFGFSVAVNPFTALAVGFLGLPGAVLVILLNFLL
jgi:inhibitor of the pro-sigma K processing machinery